MKVTGFKQYLEKLYITFYNDSETFMKKKVASYAVAVDGATVTLEISSDDLPLGTYAICMFHDENGNKKLDSGLFGIPTESYGFSNNAKGFAGPPSYKQCKFQFKDNQTIEIKLD
ncbi:DUF2141 domain-containing protein [Halosquirtibacter laminarini]|uniref:DUF2141 domain-containing protein n=1 Tax=Halosquirtibacter laminarini TaxID=3374600 RepID=A0AC61NGI8_9BACT|nr:DUF2141 domain-containing protein [Prolixibacteraceae bacterium]